jgi:endothelin-converting enzyme/putative endopeptidase
LRDDALRALVLSDPHSPEKFRTNGPVFNMDAFYAAFGVVEGDRMWVEPTRRTTIW